MRGVAAFAFHTGFGISAAVPACAAIFAIIERIDACSGAAEFAVFTVGDAFFAFVGNDTRSVARGETECREDTR